MLHFIGYLLSGLVVGFAANAFKPNEDRMNLLKMVGLASLGAVLAGWCAGYVASVLGAVLIVVAHHYVSRQQTLT